MDVTELNHTPVTKEQIADWLTKYIMDLRGIQRERIGRAVTFDKFGLDSASAVQLTGDLMDWLQCDVDPSVIYEYPTIDALSGYLIAVAQGAAE